MNKKTKETFQRYQTILQPTDCVITHIHVPIFPPPSPSFSLYINIQFKFLVFRPHVSRNFLFFFHPPDSLFYVFNDCHLSILATTALLCWFIYHITSYIFFVCFCDIGRSPDFIFLKR